MCLTVCCIYLSTVSNFSECGKNVENSLIHGYACLLMLQGRLEAVVNGCLLLCQLSAFSVHLPSVLKSVSTC